MALPVTLTGFRAGRSGNKSVELIWQTAYEANSEAFVVERSEDGSNWEAIKTVAA